MSKQALRPISAAEIDEFESALFSEAFEEDSLDYFGIHGLLCAMVVGPNPMTAADWMNMAFGQPVSASNLPDYDKFCGLLKIQSQWIRSALDEELPIDLPAEIYDDRDALTNWCIGFVEGFLANESQWFANKQELVAELMLPIMAVSDLFEDEDFQQIKANHKLMDQLCEQIPEVLTDLYLLFHSGE